jgi:hypothetical protein
MNLRANKLMKKLIDLQIQAEKIDETLRNLRVEINNMFWSTQELRERNITQLK